MRFLFKVKIFQIFPFYVLFLSPFCPAIYSGLDVCKYASRGKNGDSASDCSSPFLNKDYPAAVFFNPAAGGISFVFPEETMPRFFIEGIAPGPGDRITLSEEDSRHVALSLRMKRGESLTLCDGDGTDYECRAVDFGDAVTVEVISSSPSAGEPSFRATVYQAEIKGDKFDTVIQKTVELGAAGIVPFVSSRCVSRPDPRDADKKKKRRERIALEAAKQCGRGIVPPVGATVPFEKAAEEAAKADLPLFCWEEATLPLKDVIRGRDPSTVSVVIGPEGGFSAEEAKAAEAAGLITVSLGRRILRTETAAGAVLSVLSYEFDN